MLGDNTSTVEASFQKHGTRENKWNDKTVKTCKQSALKGELTYANVNNDLQVHNRITVVQILIKIHMLVIRKLWPMEMLKTLYVNLMKIQTQLYNCIMTLR